MTKRFSLFLILILVVGGIILYWYVDPTMHVWMPKCPFRLLTGWNCPACGAQRALHALLNGKFAEALAYNYLFLFAIPYAIALVVAEVLQALHRGERFIRWAQHPVIARVYLVLFLIWGVVRNLLGV